MTVGDTLRVALRALLKNKMRAFLTVLGVVIGIAAVTTLVSIGQGAGRLITDQFESFGTNVIMVMPGSRMRGGVRRMSLPTLTAADADAIRQDCPAVIASSPIVGISGQVIYGNANWSPKQIQGVTPDYLTVRNLSMAAGTFIGSHDLDGAAKVCVIGHTLVGKLFQTANPLGKTVRIRNIPFRVIGVLKEKGAGMGGEDQDDTVLVPQTTVSRRMYASKFKHVHFIMASARSPELMSEATTQVKQVLLLRHEIDNIKSADFRVQNTTEMAAAMGMITGTLTLLLSAIAGISLLVGGVGIMNIMLVSVTERTREIGIRMAIGARGSDILRQFLIESVVLSCIGGAIGLALGTGASAVASILINSFNPTVHWPMVISLPAAMLAMGFAAVVGIFFGYYPARRASKLDPIDALRYE